MKSTALFFSAVCLISLSSVAQNKSISFEHSDFKTIKEKALKEGKLIFIDAYTTWCGPCKYMAKNIFTNDTVADYYNKNFINAKIDMEKGEGIDLAKEYEVMCYPNLLFVDGKGNLIHRTAGSMNASQFVALAKTAQNPEQRFAYFKENYESRKKDVDFLKKYIELKTNTCLEPTVEIAYYFSTQQDEELKDARNWEMVQAYTNSMDSREFKYLIAHRQEFEKAYTEAAVNAKIEEVCYNSLVEVAKQPKFDEKAYENVKKQIRTMNLPYQDKIFFNVDLRLAKKNENWAEYSRLAVENVDKYYSADPDMLNSVAWTFYEHVTDPAALQKAESWAAKGVEHTPQYYIMDTYAYLLYKNGKLDQALAMANKAIDQAKKKEYSEDDYKSSTDLVKLIKSKPKK